MIKEALGKDVVVVEDALPKELFKHLKNQIIDYRFPWHHVYNSAFVEQSEYINNGKANNIYDYSFAHIAYENFTVTSQIYDLSYAALLCALSKVNLEISRLFRIRLGMHTPSKELMINDPHVDNDHPHIAGLLYLNECDADTYFFNQRWNGKRQQYEEEDFDRELIAQIKPKENRFVFFDGTMYHSSSRQTNTSQRIVINYNFEI